MDGNLYIRGKETDTDTLYFIAGGPCLFYFVDAFINLKSSFSL